MGYPNPEQIPLIDDVEFRGICVYVPNEPEYVQALLGSLAGLAQWVNWQRDPQQSASKSANLWRLANNLTVETWENPCGCGEMNCEDIREIIREELENMTISITNTNTNCCCGAGGTGTGTDMPPVTSPAPPGVDNPPMPTIPPGDDDPEFPSAAYQAYSCNMSHYMYFLIRSAVIEIRASWARNHMLSVGAFLPGRADAGPFVRPGGADIAPWNYWDWLLVAKSETDMSDLVREMDNAYDNLVCALSGSLTASVRRSRFLTVVDAMAISENQRRWMRLAVSGIEFQSWFNPANFNDVQASIPASYEGRSCPCAPAAAALSILEDFSGISDLEERWTTERGTVVGETANLNSTDVHASYLQLLQADLVDKWQGTPALYDNVVISFRWRAVEVNDPTATFRLTGQQSPGVTSTLWQSVFGAAGGWATVTLEPMTLNFTSQAGLPLLTWNISGTSTRQIVEVDDIMITGDAA